MDLGSFVVNAQGLSALYILAIYEIKQRCIYINIYVYVYIYIYIYIYIGLTRGVVLFPTSVSLVTPEPPRHCSERSTMRKMASEHAILASDDSNRLSPPWAERIRKNCLADATELRSRAEVDRYLAPDRQLLSHCHRERVY